MPIKWIIWRILSRFRSRALFRVPDFAPRRVLVMRYGFLGDVLQTTPVLRVVRKKWPDARIDYWVSGQAAPALEHTPYITSIISADKHGALSIRRPIAVVRHAMMLRRARYDLAICLGADPFYGFLAWLADIKCRSGLIVSRKKSAFLNVWVETPLSDRVSRQQRYLELVQRLGIDVSAGDAGIRMSWSSEDERKTDALLGRSHGKLLAFFCGTGPPRFRPWANRSWDAGSWTALAEKIIHNYSEVKILLIGAEREAEINEKIASALPGDRVLDISGQTSFSQLAPVLKKCMLLVSNDSSPVFVASAVDCPTVVIYGPEWPARPRPLGAQDWHPVYREMPCRDVCSSFPDRAPECENECMSQVTVGMVFDNVESVLNGKGSFCET